MSTQVQTLLEAALELSEIEREELAVRIYDSLGDPETEIDEDGWKVEYIDYGTVGVPLLPTKVFASKGDYKVRLSIREWAAE